ncbi:MAG: HD domain-containing protein [Bacteroidales bacterium]
MTQEDFVKIKDWFKLYTAQFHSNDEDFQRNIELKIAHSYRVVENVSDLIQSIDLSKKDHLVAETAALLHDIGRFRQFEQYGTFSDKKSVNHALLSVKVIKDKELIEHLEAKEQKKILAAIYNHNKKSIPENLNNEEALLLKILRDADKLDIWKIVTDYYCNEETNSNNALQLDLLDDPSINPVNSKDILNERMVDLNNLKTLNDFKLLQVGWVYDLNFKRTFEILYERNYLDEIFKTLPNIDQITVIKEKIYSYIKEQINFRE